ncbi:hypothetical protein [Cyanobium sp. NIES-981]|uniref:hypothetical protein n=1 Tax=Cyanobium sp. NIES-981 TaxID=1851505 RepID=UPI0007DE1533|nr:hypothetical protein [Cyanobium sp. NIES-981]SBO42483.1 exported protein of unknown function [Cyanobium sp. NIES-981]
MGFSVLAVAACLQLSGVASAQTLITGGCPLLVPASQRDLQPKRLPPEQVAGKNRRGCLSPFDAVYGPDGCPQRLCGPEAGVIQLPLP